MGLHMKEKLDNLPSSYVAAAILIAAAVAILAGFLATRDGELRVSDETATIPKQDKPEQVVEAFFTRMDEGDCDGAMSLLLFDELRNAGLKVEVAIRDTASDSEIQALGDELRSMEEVQSAYLVSREEVLARTRQSLGEDSVMMDELSINPLPAFYEVTLRDSSNAREVTARFYDNPAVDASQFSAPVSVRDQALSSCELLVDRYDYQLKEFTAITEKYLYDDSNVRFSAVASMGGASSTPGEFEFVLKQSNEAWKIDYFSTLASINGTAGYFSLVLVNNPEMADRIDSLSAGQSQLKTSTAEPAPAA